MDIGDLEILRTSNGQTAVLAHWLHCLGEDAPELDPALLRRALLEAYGARGGASQVVYEVPNPVPPFPPAPTA